MKEKKTKKLSNYEMVKEFHEKFKDPGPTSIQMTNTAQTILRLALIKEEFAELLHELGITVEYNFGVSEDNVINDMSDVDIKKLAKELADLLYVVYGFACKVGIPIDEVFAKVHQSNMTKLGPDGNPIFREDGKILKSENYKPADLFFLNKL